MECDVGHSRDYCAILMIMQILGHVLHSRPRLKMKYYGDFWSPDLSTKWQLVINTACGIPVKLVSQTTTLVYQPGLIYSSSSDPL